MDELIKSAFRVIDDFSETGPSAARVADAQLAVRRDLENDLQQNRYLLNEITDEVRERRGRVRSVRGASGIDELTPAAIRDAARRYLNKSRYVEVTLSPEKKLPAAGEKLDQQELAPPLRLPPCLSAARSAGDPEAGVSTGTGGAGVDPSRPVIVTSRAETS